MSKKEKKMDEFLKLLEEFGITHSAKRESFYVVYGQPTKEIVNDCKTRVSMIPINQPSKSLNIVLHISYKDFNKSSMPFESDFYIARVFNLDGVKPKFIMKKMISSFLKDANKLVAKGIKNGNRFHGFTMFKHEKEI